MNQSVVLIHLLKMDHVTSSPLFFQPLPPKKKKKQTVFCVGEWNLAIFILVSHCTLCRIICLFGEIVTGVTCNSVCEINH